MLGYNRFLQPVQYLARNVRLMTTKHSNADLVLTREVNNNGHIILNRTSARNVMNKTMIEQIHSVLCNWKDSKSMIIVRGNGNAFCAGGDVKDFVQNDLDYGLSVVFTGDMLMHTVANLKIPYIALIDGLTMGGGVGLTIFGKYRIATERTLFAMPETKIGHFPDTGASYYFPRLQGKLGFYLGLTGVSLTGANVLHAGIATHYCDSSKIPDLEHTLLQLKDSSDVDGVINDFCPKVQSDFILAKHLDEINECFDASSVEEIFLKLEKNGSKWAKDTIKNLRSGSPTSLKVTFQLLNLGANMSLKECFQMEYQLFRHVLLGHDFNEGVRALLIRKDRKPKWKPTYIEDVSDEYVQSFFKPLPSNMRLPLNE